MASLPGPAELQVHFEKVHSEQDGGNEESMESEDQVIRLFHSLQENGRVFAYCFISKISLFKIYLSSGNIIKQYCFNFKFSLLLFI